MEGVGGGREQTGWQLTNIGGCFARLHRQDGYGKKCSVFQGTTLHKHSLAGTKKVVPKEERRDE